MEGLIPFVYRAIRKNKTRRQYECLSSGAALNYNISDFDVNDSGVHFKPSAAENMNMDAERKGHRRYWSVIEDFSSGGFSPANNSITTNAAAAASKPKELVRFRSQRMLSCVTGA